MELNFATLGASGVLASVIMLLYHLFFGARATAKTPAEQVIALVGGALSDILKTHASTAVKGSIGSLIGPALLNVAQQFVENLKTPGAAVPPKAG